MAVRRPCVPHVCLLAAGFSPVALTRLVICQPCGVIFATTDRCLARVHSEVGSTVRPLWAWSHTSQHWDTSMLKNRPSDRASCERHACLGELGIVQTLPCDRATYHSDREIRTRGFVSDTTKINLVTALLKQYLWLFCACSTCESARPYLYFA